MKEVGELKGKAVSGAIWKFLERMSAQLVSMVVAIILARLLNPEDYSVVSIVHVFFTFANVFISGGFNAALIQKKNADEEDYSSVLFLSISVSILIYTILFIGAPTVAKLYDKAMLCHIIRVMGLILPINAIKSIVCAYISSNLQFKKFFFATFGGTVISAFVGIGMAYAGFGSWALVAQQMTNTFIDTLILCLITRIPLGFKWSFERIKRLFSYGWHIFVSSTIAVIYTEINPLFIGLKYSGTDLAFYSKGKSFPSLITTVCNSTFSSVLFSIMSKLQDSTENLLKCTRTFIRLTTFILFPAMLGFFAVSDNFVMLILTEKWLPAARYIRIFCLSEMFASIQSSNCETIKAMGKSDIFLKMEIIKKTCYFIIIGIAMVLTDSPVHLAYSAIACTAVALIVNCTPNVKLLGYKVKYQLQDILPNLINSLIMCAVITNINVNSVSIGIELGCQIIVGVMIYIVLGIITRNESLIYIWNNLTNRIPKAS